MLLKVNTTTGILSAQTAAYFYSSISPQAAIGAVALDTAVSMGRTDLVPYGNTILTCAVLSILITAPLGALFIDLAAPRLLHQDPPRVTPVKDNDDE